MFCPALEMVIFKSLSRASWYLAKHSEENDVKDEVERRSNTDAIVSNTASPTSPSCLDSRSWVNDSIQSTCMCVVVCVGGCEGKKERKKEREKRTRTDWSNSKRVDKEREICFVKLRIFNAASVSRFIRCLFFEANIVHVFRRDIIWLSSSSCCFVEDGEDDEEAVWETLWECDVMDVRRNCTGFNNLICNSRARDIAKAPKLAAPKSNAALRIVSSMGDAKICVGTQGTFQCENPIKIFSSSL